MRHHSYELVDDEDPYGPGSDLVLSLFAMAMLLVALIGTGDAVRQLETKSSGGAGVTQSAPIASDPRPPADAVMKMIKTLQQSEATARLRVQELERENAELAKKTRKKEEIDQTIIKELQQSQEAAQLRVQELERENAELTKKMREKAEIDQTMIKVLQQSEEAARSRVQELERDNAGLTKKMSEEIDKSSSAPTPDPRLTVPYPQGEPEPEPPMPWLHNGSSFNLVTTGDRKKFIFTGVRPGLREEGVRPGVVIFEGAQNGRSVEGTAYVFSKKCGAVSYFVTGYVSADERRIFVNGLAPQVDVYCNPVSYYDATMEFERAE